MAEAGTASRRVRANDAGRHEGPALINPPQHSLLQAGDSGGPVILQNSPAGNAVIVGVISAMSNGGMTLLFGDSNTARTALVSPSSRPPDLMAKNTKTSQRAIRAVVLLTASTIMLNACGTSSDPSARGRDLANQPFPTRAVAQPDSVKIPWNLIRIDMDKGRVYLSASTHLCVRPSFAVVTEDPGKVAISVYGEGPSTPRTQACSASLTTLVGYVAVQGGVRTRTVVGGQPR